MSLSKKAKMSITYLVLVIGVAAAVITSYPEAMSSSLYKKSSVLAGSYASEFVAVSTDVGNLWVARKEVTVGQWLKCQEDRGCQILVTDSSKPDHPMTGVNWRDTTDFLKWYSDNYAVPVRLPSREEWLKFAAEDAPKPKIKLFDDPRLAWAADYDLTAVPQSRVTEFTGSFGVNSLNIYDLRGNVWEWVDTCQVEIDLLLRKSHGCITGRYAMGQRIVVLSDLIRNPGNVGCGGGSPPANVGFRLVWSES